MKIRQWISLLMTAAMAVSLAGCAANPAPTTSAATQSTVAETKAPNTPPATEPDKQPEPAIVTDGEGWYLWDDSGTLTIEGREASGKTAVVSAGKYEASKAGIEVLKAGGNAVDAAVAVAFALGVCEPNSSGLGGGGFMTIRSENGDTLFIDFRERAPQAATPALWAVNSEGKVIGGQNMTGGKAVGIPGEVAGMAYAFEQFGSGKLTWEQLLAPAIELAEEGFLVTPTLANDMANNYDAMVTYPEFGEVFLNEYGLNYQIGDTIKNPAIAKTLRMIASGGKDAFYTGELAEAMVAAINKYGGVFTLEDFANYQVRTYEPAQGTYRGNTILSSPLPSSGGTHIIEWLNILENFDMESMGLLSAESLHLMAEAFKLVYYDRSQYMGDPEYVDVPTKGLLDKAYAEKLSEQIDPESVITAFEKVVDPWIYEHEDTTHFSIADAKGNIVSVTQTVNGIFGAKVVPGGYGFVLNNEMGDFSSNPESPNAIAPGKTPLSSMSPTIVLREDGSPFFCLGSPGGTTIINAVAQIISYVIDYKQPIQDAINLPRLSQKANNKYSYEGRYEKEVVDALAALGHEMDESAGWNRSFGSVNGVEYGKDGMLYGGADPRRDAKALAY